MTVAELLEGIVDDAGGSPSVSVAELLEVRGSSSLLRKTAPGQPGTGRRLALLAFLAASLSRLAVRPSSVVSSRWRLALLSHASCMRVQAKKQFALAFGPLIDIAPAARAARFTASC